MTSAKSSGKYASLPSISHSDAKITSFPNTKITAKSSDKYASLPSISKSTNSANRTLRKKSSLEHKVIKKNWIQHNLATKQRKYMQLKERQLQMEHTLTAANLKRGDRNLVGPSKTRNYGCSICHKSGHRYKHCPEIVQHGIPLEIKSFEQREILCARLWSIKGSTLMRQEKYERSIMISCPKSILGVIIHARYWKTRNQQDKDPSDLCLKCTFICDFGQKIYCRCLFNVSCVTAYITKSLTNIIVTKL